MGAVVFSVRDFYDQSSELVGIKSGLLLGDYSINKILREKFQDDFLGDENDSNFIRLRAEEIEAMIKYIRVKIGNIPSNHGINYYRLLADRLDQMRFMELYGKYVHYAHQFYLNGTQLTYADLQKEITKEKKLDIECIEALTHVVMEKVDDSILFPSSRPLENAIPLQSLFDLELFPQTENTFIDQKFIDYLAKNGNEIEEIHWRNFERFVAEYFKRQGFTVVLGPGRNDGGVDIRVFNEKDLKTPYILIQCKRHKLDHKVSIETVKAFHSDLLFEKAKKGLIATTSKVAKGGHKVVTARDYQISFAENENVKKWATSMWEY